MTKRELAAYAGTRFYNLSTRPGAKRGTLYCLTVYEVQPNGTCKYQYETLLHCIANKRSYELLEQWTNGIYHKGRPTAANITHEFMTAVLGFDEGNYYES